MNVFGAKAPSNGVQPWSQIVTLAEAGNGCDGLFGLYNSLGNVTLTGANTIAALQDGPEKVVRCGNLVLGDGTTATSLTASQRCKGLVVLCDSLTVKNNATLNMTGKGARVLVNDDPFFPFVDYRIPFRIALASSRMTLTQALAVIKANGLAPWDSGTLQHLVASMYGFDLSVSLTGSVALIQVSGCGQSVSGIVSCNGSALHGNTGLAGTNGGPGGGGSGAAFAEANAYVTSRKGSAATPYSGGSATGGAFNSASTNSVACCSAGPYSGPGGNVASTLGWSYTYSDVTPFDTTIALPYGAGGGGAGNPGGKGYLGQDGGNGVGGKLTIICLGTINIQSGGRIEANGMPGGAGIGAYPGGAGSGGGHISIITPTVGNLVNSGTIQAAGAPGGIGNGAGNGGSGGAGSVVTKTFSQMGWT